LQPLTICTLFPYTTLFRSYEEIYESLGEETKEHYDQEDVTERYHKLYEDLGVESQSIDNLELNEENSTDYNKIYEGDWTIDSAYGELTKVMEISLLYNRSEERRVGKECIS